MTTAQRVSDIYLNLHEQKKAPFAKNSSSVPVTVLKQYVGTYWSEKTGAKEFALCFHRAFTSPQPACNEASISWTPNVLGRREMR